MEIPAKQTNETTVDGSQIMEWVATTPETVIGAPACLLSSPVAKIPRNYSGNNAFAGPSHPPISPSSDSPILRNSSGDDLSDNTSNTQDLLLRSPSESEGDEPSEQPGSILRRSRTSTSNGQNTNHLTPFTFQRRGIGAPPAEFLNPVCSSLAIPPGRSLYFPAELFYPRWFCEVMQVNDSWHIRGWPHWVEPPSQVILSGSMNRSGGVNILGDVPAVNSVQNSGSYSRSPVTKPPHRYALPK